MTDNQPDMPDEIYVTTYEDAETGYQHHTWFICDPNPILSTRYIRADLCAAVSDAPTDKERVEGLGENDVVAIVEIDSDGENTPSEALHHELTRLHNKGIIKSFLTGDDAISALTTPDQREVIKALVEALGNAENLCKAIVKGYPDPDISHVDYRIQVTKWAQDFLQDDAKALALAEKAGGA